MFFMCRHYPFQVLTWNAGSVGWAGANTSRGGADTAICGAIDCVITETQ